jgi:hypothetical protein
MSEIKEKLGSYYPSIILCCNFSYIVISAITSGGILVFLSELSQGTVFGRNQPCRGDAVDRRPTWVTYSKTGPKSGWFWPRYIKGSISGSISDYLLLNAFMGLCRFPFHGARIESRCFPMLSTGLQTKTTFRVSIRARLRQLLAAPAWPSTSREKAPLETHCGMLTRSSIQP